MKILPVFVWIMLAAVMAACAELKESAKAVGHGTKQVTTEIGHASRDTVKSIGKGTKKIVKDVAD